MSGLSFPYNGESSIDIVLLVVEPTHLKNMLVKMGIISPRFGVKIENIWNHHPVVHDQFDMKWRL